MTTVDEPRTIDDLCSASRSFGPWLRDKKAGLEEPEFWYPYLSIGNIEVLKQLLPESHRDVARLAAAGPVADIGAADGDCSFFLESEGFEVHLVDHPDSNYNRMRGAYRLKEALGSSVEIHEIDLDAQPTMPGEYGLALFLGILYHLKNPIGVLAALARQVDYLVLSTKVARRTPGGEERLEGLPVGYLVGADELNADRTNFWIFSDTGLQRVLDRAGWEVLASLNVGNTTDSEPRGGDKDERAYRFARSTIRSPG